MGYSRAFSLSVLLVSSVVLSACGSSNSSTPSDSGTVSGLTCPNGHAAVAKTQVTVADFSFTPDCIVVPAGSTVTWTNTGMPTHTVTSDTGAPVTFDSGPLGSAGVFHWTFADPGMVNYHCTVHQSLGMVGTVIVQ
jgi:plastocyanin